MDREEGAREPLADGPEVSVVLPTYNEAGHIVDLVTHIGDALAAAGLTYEIVIVDDDSPDGTAELLQRRFRDDSRVRCVRRTEDRGLGSAIGHGIALSRGASVAVLDADFNHDPRLIPGMLKLLGRADLVVGSRFVPGGGMPDRRRHWASYIFNLLVRVLILTPVHDNLSGFFVARRPWLQGIVPETVFYGYGDYFMRLLSLARRSGLVILETPVMYGARPSGTSKTSFVRTPIRYLGAALQLALRSGRPEVRAPSRGASAPARGSIDP